MNAPSNRHFSMNELIYMQIAKVGGQMPRKNCVTRSRDGLLRYRLGRYHYLTLEDPTCKSMW